MAWPARSTHSSGWILVIRLLSQLAADAAGPASGAVGGQAECRRMQPPGDGHDRLGIAGAGGDLVVAQRQEAAVLHCREVLAGAEGLQELLLLGDRRGAVVVDDDALRLSGDNLLPRHRRPALLERAEDVCPAAEADQRRRDG